MMLEYSDAKRCEVLGRYMLEHRSTVRATAKIFGISKSTVHKDVTLILAKENRALWLLVKALLDENKSERHVRGGEATKRKYQSMKKGPM